MKCAERIFERVLRIVDNPVVLPLLPILFCVSILAVTALIVWLV